MGMDDLELPPRFELRLEVLTPDDRRLGIRMFALADYPEAAMDYTLREMSSQVKAKLREEGYFDG
jgi:hypothetical protein